jgi:beta-lactamase regulating signal transducer with metallopeptidase domain
MDAIANHVWQSTIFAAGAGVTTVMFRRNSASVRYWLWFSAALKFLIPFAALSAAADYIPLPEPPRAAGAAVDAAITAFRTSAVPAVPLAASILLVIVWISGVVLELARWFTQWRDLIAHARRCPEVVDGTVHDKVRRVERSEGITTRISIVASDRAFEPGVIGVWSPMLIWPPTRSATSCGATTSSPLRKWPSARRSGSTPSSGLLARGWSMNANARAMSTWLRGAAARQRMPKAF